MTTLALLKAEIADDLDRNDLTTQIATEIPRAIRHYQKTRFYFNETRDETFTTIAAQKLYSSSDAASIVKFITVDMIYVMDGNEPTELGWIQPDEWELATASGSSQGSPKDYCYFNRSIGLYPIPDDAYTVRIVGHIMKDAPASDDEAGNVWMLEAFDLIRARVCGQLGLRKLRDAELVQMHKGSEQIELDRLLNETSSRIGTGRLTPTQF